MAKNIKGITIEIGGNTTKLQDALKDVNKVIYSTNSELKGLKQALAIDPKNVELLAQKQEVLKKNIQETTNKLNTLKEAQRQMGDYNKLTDEQKESYRALSVEITKTKGHLEDMNKELKGTSSIDMSKIGDGLKKVGDIAADVLKKVTEVTMAVGSALAGVVAAGVKSYAELEQNIGGVETLFGDSADKVIANAKKAYETAGVSANEYMAGVTSFSASLLQSLGGDTEKAAEIADMAFIDMSDNANKFGTSMESIQNAYQGFAKQNYTMLDNLKLGYGGTKTEMERLLADAEKFSGVHYDINNLSDVYSAIHVIQEELGVTGTTAEEASTTISGSAKSMKAAFDNFLNGSGGVKELAETIKTFIKNVVNVVKELAPELLGGIGDLIEEVLPEIGQLIIDMLPQLLTAAQNLLTKLVDLISKNVKPISDMIVTFVNSIVKFVVDNLPAIIDAGLKILLALVQGIAENLDELIPALVDAILTIVDTLTEPENIELLIEAGIALIVGVAKGLIKAIPKLVEKIPQIISNLVTALLNEVGKFLDVGIDFIVEVGKGLVEGVPQAIAKIGEIVGDIIQGFLDAIVELWNDFIDLGAKIGEGIWNGLKESFNIAGKAGNWFVSTGNNIVTGFKKFFHINSPSRLMRDEIGYNLMAGIAEGIEDGVPDTIREVNSAMKDLNYGIQQSVNPTINPTANSNPLIIQIENFNNQRETDIEILAEELEYYRKNSSLAIGGE